MNLEACLPIGLQGPTTTITRIAAGLSGAGVHRVQAGDDVYVLKVAAQDAPIGTWRHTLDIQRRAADAGLAPRIIHTDEERRAVLSAFVVDRSFAAQYGNPASRDAALTLLGTTLRRIHQLPADADAAPTDPRTFLSGVRSTLGAATHPAFVTELVQRVLAENAPAGERRFVLCHNDVNPTNLVHDGERLVLLDWETAGVNDAYYDLGAIAFFLRMDDATCLQLLSAYEGAPVAEMPELFAWNRRLAGTLCGSVFLRLAHQGGHAGATDETLENTPSMLEFYQRMQAGAVNLATPDGQWKFGLALTKAAAQG